jgi:hypothetical protein
MLGVVALLLFMAVLFPVGFLVTNAAVAALFSKVGTEDAEARFEGTELLELSKRH